MNWINNSLNNATYSAFSHQEFVFISRFAVSFVYYALVINTENLSGNIFLNFFFGALVEIPAFVLCIFLLNRVGRKKLFIAFIVTGGICGIVTIFPFIYAPDGKKSKSFIFLYVLKFPWSLFEEFPAMMRVSCISRNRISSVFYILIYQKP